MHNNISTHRPGILEAIAFYENNYESAGEWLLKEGEEIVLSRRDGKHVCRFCGRDESATTFAKIAHAVPESLGNKTLFSKYECDECNGQFGETIENDLGNWTKPLRTMLRILGKKGVPTLAQGPKNGWRIEYKNERLEIKSYESNPIYTVDEENKVITFTLRRDSFTPMGVLKAFFKIALTVMSEDDVAHYLHALAWLKAPHEPAPHASIPVLRSFVPGPVPNDQIHIRLFRRKRDEIALPYMFMLFMYGNEMFQVFLGSATRDAHLVGKNSTVYHYPTQYDLLSDWPYGETRKGHVKFDGVELVRGETFTLTSKFDQLIEIEAPKLE